MPGGRPAVCGSRRRELEIGHLLRLDPTADRAVAHAEQSRGLRNGQELGSRGGWFHEKPSVGDTTSIADITARTDILDMTAPAENASPVGVRSELERVAHHPPVAELLGRARARAGGAQSTAIVAAIRAGRDRD